MQIERLIQMIFYMIDSEHATAQELADYFGVSTRTIYRDINTLTLAGIPILSTKGTGGGISLMEGYTLDRSLLSKEDQQNIYQGLHILKATKYPNAEIALGKISSVFRKTIESKWLEVDFSYWGSDETEKIKISDLQYAILNKHVLSFTYFNTELQRSERFIEPLRLVFKSHAWYIVGYCHSAKEIRMFRISRMKDVIVTSETFVRRLPPEYSFISKEETKYDLLVFKLKFSSEMAHRIYDEFQESQVTLCEDGGYLVTVQYEMSNWTIHHLLSFGKYLEVIEPESVRQTLRERALEIAQIYK